MKKAAIIGGSGFIGSYVTKKFLTEGYYVKVSSTDIKNKSKYQHLLDLPNADNLEICQLRVEDKEALTAFVRDCEIVVHGGTPFQLDVKDPQTELFDPTINGTENFLDVIQHSPSVQQIVFIASVAAHNTNFPLAPSDKSADFQMSESDQPFSSKESHPYGQAKFIANQVVEKFITKHADLPFEITTVSPVGVMGKALSQREDSTSMGLQFLFKNKIAPNPFIQMLYDLDIEFAMVDVKDVAEGVFKAATTKGLHGKKYLLASESYRISDITRMLNLEEPISKPTIVYKNDLAKRELGITFNPAQIPLNQFSK